MDEYWNAENEQPKEEAIPPVAPPPMEPVNPAEAAPVAPPAEAPRQEAHTYQVPPYYAPYQPY